ncbi:hypothetical protein [Rhodococcus qingshengii]|uniref:hypothetical protein n=1 Tax=Rhodococcus qingshengii TaxID=334542 RepID=UPI0035D83714
MTGGPSYMRPWFRAVTVKVVNVIGALRDAAREEAMEEESTCRSTVRNARRERIVAVLASSRS